MVKILSCASVADHSPSITPSTITVRRRDRKKYLGPSNTGPESISLYPYFIVINQPLIHNLGLPEPGAIVHVRQRLYLVEQVVSASNPGDMTLLCLTCVDDDAQGQLLEVLWESEIDAKIRDGENWRQIAARGFDPPNKFAAYLNTLRWNCVTSTDSRLLQSPFRAGIRLDPYQLEPLRKALRLPRVNIFIADDVGLGKTIEAGLIARELLLRKKIRDIVVNCPPSMLLQWQEELSARFGLQFEILDKEAARLGFAAGFDSGGTDCAISQELLPKSTAMKCSPIAERPEVLLFQWYS